jgi:hypothetical protein
MNTQASPTETREAPTVTLVVSNPLFPASDPSGTPKESLEPVTWILNRPHPFVPAMKIVGMFLNRIGVEIYSTNEKIGMRDLIPMSSVRLTQEGMALDVFEEEFALAEAGDDDDDDLDDSPPEPQAEPESEAPTANGQA